MLNTIICGQHFEKRCMTNVSWSQIESIFFWKSTIYILLALCLWVSYIEFLFQISYKYIFGNTRLSSTRSGGLHLYNMGHHTRFQVCESVHESRHARDSSSTFINIPTCSHKKRVYIRGIRREFGQKTYTMGSNLVRQINVLELGEQKLTKILYVDVTIIISSTDLLIGRYDSQHIPPKFMCCKTHSWQYFFKHI